MIFWVGVSLMLIGAYFSCVENAPVTGRAWISLGMVVLTLDYVWSIAHE